VESCVGVLVFIVSPGAGRHNSSVGRQDSKNNSNLVSAVSSVKF
jgi:hypothetical protein